MFHNSSFLNIIKKSCYSHCKCRLTMTPSLVFWVGFSFRWEVFIKIIYKRCLCFIRILLFSWYCNFFWFIYLFLNHQGGFCNGYVKNMEGTESGSDKCLWLPVRFLNLRSESSIKLFEGKMILYCITGSIKLRISVTGSNSDCEGQNAQKKKKKKSPILFPSCSLTSLLNQSCAENLGKFVLHVNILRHTPVPP